MKQLFFIIATFAVLPFAEQLTHAQSFNINLFAIGAGGGTSSGGDFTLNSTIGEADAGTMSGGSFSLTGGFWGANPIPVSSPTVIEVRLVGPGVYLHFNGIPGRTYEIERASSVTGPWRQNNTPLAVIIMPSAGVADFVDPAGLAFPQSFYRTRLQPR
jgi:hypothetical protein